MDKLTRFQEALCHAAALHARQRRKLSGEPYMAHLLATAALVMEYDGDEDETIAALLHDAVEDQGGQATHREIARRFGENVAAIVDGCTDARETPKPPWRRRKEAFIARLSGEPASVRLVVAADKLHNVRSLLRGHPRMGESIWEHFHGGRDGTLWYFRSVVDALRRAESSPIVEDLEEAVRRLESL